MVFIAGGKCRNVFVYSTAGIFPFLLKEINASWITNTKFLREMSIVFFICICL